MEYNYEETYDDSAESKSRKVGLFIGLGLVIAVSITIGLIFRATRPKLVPAPTAFVSVQAPDQSYVVDQPVGWASNSSSSGAIVSSSDFTAGNADISVGSDLQGSLWGDISQAQNNQLENMSSMSGVPEPPPVPPIVKVHEMGKQEVASNYANYVEQPMQIVDAKIGEGRVSEFTAQGGTFVGQLHGYRATFLSTERRITVLTVCPQRNWDILAPAFRHEIESVGKGSG